MHNSRQHIFALRMSIHNACFHGQIKKTRTPPLIMSYGFCVYQPGLQISTSRMITSRRTIPSDITLLCCITVTVKSKYLATVSILTSLVSRAPEINPFYTLMMTFRRREGVHLTFFNILLRLVHAYPCLQFKVLINYPY